MKGQPRVSDCQVFFYQEHNKALVVADKSVLINECVTLALNHLRSWCFPIDSELSEHIISLTEFLQETEQKMLRNWATNEP